MKSLLWPLFGVGISHKLRNLGLFKGLWQVAMVAKQIRIIDISVSDTKV